MIRVVQVPSRPGHRARRWLTGLLLTVLLMALLLAWLVTTLWAWQGAPVVELPFPVVVNGHDLADLIDRALGRLQALDKPARLGLVMGASLAGLLLVLLLPALLLTTALVMVSVSLAVAGLLLVLLLSVLALVLSPLLLLLGSLWWLSQTRRTSLAPAAC